MPLVEDSWQVLLTVTTRAASAVATVTVGAAAVTGLPDESAALTVKTAPVEAVGPAAVTEPEFGIYPTLTVAVRVAVLPEKVTAFVAITVPAEFLTVTVVTPARPEA